MPPVSVRVCIRVKASLSFSGCALKLTLLTVSLSNLRTIDTEPNYWPTREDGIMLSILLTSCNC